GISSVGCPKTFTCGTCTPSTLIVAIPMPRPRAPIQRMEVPLKVIEAVAPAAVDCMAEPPLHPKLASARVQAPLKLTAALDSSTRLGSVCNGAVVTPPNGCRL